MGDGVGDRMELALKLDDSHLGTIRPRIVCVWSNALGGLKLYVIFSYTRDPPCSPDGFNHWRKKAAVLVCTKSRSWESLGKAACAACLPPNKPTSSFCSPSRWPWGALQNPERH